MNCWIKNSVAIEKKSKNYESLFVSNSLFAVFVVLGYINTFLILLNPYKTPPQLLFVSLHMIKREKSLV